MAKLATLHVTISASPRTSVQAVPDILDLMDTLIDFECQMEAVDRVMREPLPDVSALGFTDSERGTE